MDPSEFSEPMPCYESSPALAPADDDGMCVHCRERGWIHNKASVRRTRRDPSDLPTVSPESQWGTAVGPGLSGVIFGTNATSLLMSPDFLGPTSACSRTSLSVSTGTISIFPW